MQHTWTMIYSMLANDMMTLKSQYDGITMKEHFWVFMSSVSFRIWAEIPSPPGNYLKQHR
jgi:hypothetical protein